MMDVRSSGLGWLRRFVRWLGASPFQGLPEEFGDPVPPELRVFEAEAEDIQHHPVGRVPPASREREETKPSRRDEWLERE